LDISLFLADIIFLLDCPQGLLLCTCSILLWWTPLLPLLCITRLLLLLLLLLLLFVFLFGFRLRLS
jgi:hypothetical protein